MRFVYGNVLLVDDEPQVRRLLRDALHDAGLAVIEAQDGQEAMLRAAVDAPMVVVLDLGLPDMAGAEIVRRVSECTDAPIIALTTIGRREDKGELLAAGAADCVAKPLRLSKLIVRVRAALRRKATGSGGEIRLGELAVDLIRHRVARNAEEVKLTRHEYAVLRALVESGGRILTYREIFGRVWGGRPMPSAGLIHTYIGRLRRKLERGCGAAPIILTERNIGYRLSAAPAAQPVPDLIAAAAPS
jgi:two-component system KDP operon response regulator KdpE